jgi:hypothetical protein
MSPQRRPEPITPAAASKPERQPAQAEQPPLACGQAASAAPPFPPLCARSSPSSPPDLNPRPPSPAPSPPPPFFGAPPARQPQLAVVSINCFCKRTERTGRATPSTRASPRLAHVPVSAPAAGTLASNTVDRHNYYRAIHSAPPLSWDASLAADTQAWASGCVYGFDPVGPGAVDDLGVFGLWRGCLNCRAADCTQLHCACCASAEHVGRRGDRPRLRQRDAVRQCHVRTGVPMEADG